MKSSHRPEVKESVAAAEEELLRHIEDQKLEITAKYTRTMEVLNKRIEAVNTTMQLMLGKTSVGESEGEKP